MLLAQYGDRPAMLDIAFAMGHGRALKRDRAASVQIVKESGLQPQ